MKKIYLAAAAGLLAGGLFTGHAKAADLGGSDCCADLEERVAELEATTARKGNRKVSLTISGWVTSQLYIWDDGVDSDVYIQQKDTTLASHFKFSGAAEITPDTSAGFVIHVETIETGGIFQTQFNDEGNTGLNTLEAYWYLKSNTLGKISLGQLSHASDNAAILADFSGTLVQANWVLFEGASFQIRDDVGDRFSGYTWGDIGYCAHIGLGIGADCNGVPLDAIRYDSPTFYGFSVSASWGENDFWDVAARYSGEWNSIKVAVVAAYSWFGDDKTGTLSGNAINENRIGSEYFQIGAMVMHTPTGLFVYGAYGTEDELAVEDRFPGIRGNLDEPEHFYIKAGIKQSWLPYGATVLFGEYAEYSDGANYNNANLQTAFLDSTELTLFGGGIVQDIDAAAMQVWVTYREYEADVEYGNGFEPDLENLQQVMVGGIIKF